MTNEEKAVEIAQESVINVQPFDFASVEYGALKMAKWKDKQMIEKACNAYCEVCSHRHAKDSFISKFCEQNDCMYICEFKKYLK